MMAAAAHGDDEVMARAIEDSLRSEEDRKTRRALEAKRRHGVEMRIGRSAPEFSPHLDPVGGPAASGLGIGAAVAAAANVADGGAGPGGKIVAAPSTTAVSSSCGPTIARKRGEFAQILERIQSNGSSSSFSSDGEIFGDDEALSGNAASALRNTAGTDATSRPASGRGRTLSSGVFSSTGSGGQSSNGAADSTSSLSKPAPQFKKQASQERRKAFEDARAAAAAAAARAAVEKEAKKEAASGEMNTNVDNNDGHASSDEDMDDAKVASGDDDGDDAADGKKKENKDAGDKEKTDGLLTCEICFNDELTEADILPFPCQHKYCRDCWKGLITSMLQSTGEGGGGGGNVDTILSTSCPSVGCNECVTELEVKELCPDLLPAFRRLQLHSFVAGRGTESSRWCPGPDCDRVAVRCRRDLFDCVDREIPTGTCGSCSTSFCFRCGEEPHPKGQTCTNANAAGDDDLFGDMGGKSGPPIKHCPKCQVKIEKNGGCNHMRCKCGHHFCWICLGDYRGRHFCGREGNRPYNAAAAAGNNAAGTAAHGTANVRTLPNFDLDYLHTTLGNSKAPDNDVDREALATFIKDKEAMDHFAHYYNRFAAHNQGQEYAETQTLCTENRVNEYGKVRDFVL